MMKHEDGIGTIIVSTLALPEWFRPTSATYLFSGKVLVTCRAAGDAKDYYRLAVVNDDGTDFRVIFAGEIPQHPKANGIRFMPFSDNKRILLGDYVLECRPDVDRCESAQLIPVIYPSCLTDNPATTMHWSEIIIAPDNRHMAWTMLRSDIGAAVCMGTLERMEGQYDIRQVQIISSLNSFLADACREGYIIPQTVRGGEVKQFVHGGRAISAVGGKTGNTPNSVVQYLDSGKLEQITYTPGYDETTIFSPDERLGIVMSTRASQGTDPAIFGLLPRPHGVQTSMGISMLLYTYAVTGVRSCRQGNIGPVLIDIEKSMKVPGYTGVSLHDPKEQWVYCSPMSWHPDSRRVLWPEMLRGTGNGPDGPVMRIRKAELPDYVPGSAAAPVDTSDDVPYGIKDIHALDNAIDANVEGRIAGKFSGYIYHVHRLDAAHRGVTISEYHDYSDDGECFYNGFERLTYGIMEESCYEADVTLAGAKTGEMKLRAAFAPVVGTNPAGLVFEPGTDGKPKSYGYAMYEGRRMDIEDMRE